MAFGAILVAARVLYPFEYVDLVRRAARDRDLDPALVASLVRAESRFRADAVSPRGAMGLMQLMPETAAWIAQSLGETAADLRDPATNLRLGAWYLRYLLDRFGRADLALAAYNAGPTRVDEWLATSRPIYAETEAFVRRVLRGVAVYRVFFAVPWLVHVAPSLPI